MTQKTTTIDACDTDGCFKLKEAECLFCGRDLCYEHLDSQQTEFKTDEGVQIELSDLIICPTCAAGAQALTALECLIQTAISSKAGKLCGRDGKILALVDTEPDEPTAPESPSYVVCHKCGADARTNKSKYCGDGSDKDNAHDWHKPVPIGGGEPIAPISAIESTRTRYVRVFGEAYRMSTGYHQWILSHHLGLAISRVEDIAEASGMMLAHLAPGKRDEYATRGNQDPDACKH